MEYIALVLSVLAIDFAIWPRTAQAWVNRDSKLWAVGGMMWIILSKILLLAIFVDLLTHITVVIK